MKKYIDDSGKPKQGIFLIKNKRYIKKFVFNQGYKIATYEYPNVEIQFKNNMINDINQHYCGGWNFYGLDYSNEALYQRVLHKLKPMAVLYTENKLEALKLVSLAKKDGIEVFISHQNWERWDITTNAPITLLRYDIMICQKGTMGELFDLKTLKEDYIRALYFSTDHKRFDEVVNKKLSDYFKDWDHQDEGSDVECWETGLILGYPIENTMALYCR